MGINVVGVSVDEAGAQRCGRLVSPGPQAAQYGEHFIIELHAQAFQPFNGGVGIFNKYANQLRVSYLVAAVKGLLEVLVNGIFNSLCFLTTRVNGIEGTTGKNGVTTQSGHLFDDNDIGTVLVCGNSSCQSGTAAADHHYIGFVGYSFTSSSSTASAAFQGFNVSTCLLKSINNGSHQSIAGNSCARNGVHCQVLLSKNGSRNSFENKIGDASAFFVVGGFNTDNFISRNRDFHSEVSVVSGYSSCVGACLEQRISGCFFCGCCGCRRLAGSQAKYHEQRQQ